jgi:hypothetical protein
MKLLELFCGTKSVGKIFSQNGWEVVSVDIEKKYNPTILTNVMDFDYTSYPSHYFDIIWASPPCATFSTIYGSFHKYSKEKIKQDMEEKGLPLLRKAQEIINYFQPKFWFIENPATGRMKNYMDNIPFIDVDYCQYGYLYRKRTRIWTNLAFIGKKCNCKKKHTVTIGKFKCAHTTTLQQRYSIPPELIKSIYNTLLCYL